MIKKDMKSQLYIYTLVAAVCITAITMQPPTEVKITVCEGYNENGL